MKPKILAEEGRSMYLPSRLRSGKIFLAFLLLVVGILSCAGLQEKAGAPAPAATLVVTPVTGLPGAVIAIRGSGFIPGEKIEVVMVIDGVPTELGEAPIVKEANEMGAFKTKSGIPIMAAPGIYSVKATGDKGTMAVAPLEVEKKPEKKK